MSNIVKGEDAIIYIWDAPIWKIFVCARSFSFNIVTDTIESSVAGSGVWRTFEATANSWDGSFAGIVALMITGTLSYADLQLLQITQTKLLIRFERTSQAGDIYTTEGKAIIIDSGDESSFDNLDTFQMQIKGTGALTQIFTVTPNPSNTCKVKRYDYTGVGGEDSFSTALLNGKDVLEIVKDGLGKAAIITSGTPVNIEAKYTSSGGVGIVQFPNPFEAGEKAYALYQDI